MAHNDYAERYANRHQRLLTGDEQPPLKISQLALDSQDRLNRLALSRGYMGVWWDTEAKQAELADSFTPIALGKLTDRVYPDSRIGEAVRRIHETLDRQGFPAFPAIEKEERFVESWLKLQCTLADKLGGTTHLRPLRFNEKRRLLALHKLSKDADVIEVNTGSRS